MSNPVQHRSHRPGALALRQRRALHHHHGQAQGACGIELAARGLAACVLGHQPFDAVRAQQGLVIGRAERTAPQHHRGVGQGQAAGLGRIDQAQQIVVLRLARKGRKLLAAHGQKHPGGCLGQGGSGGLHVGHVDPGVAGTGLPGLALQRQQRRAGGGAGLAGIAAHLRGKRMGGIDHMADGLPAQELRQALRAAKASHAGGQGLGHGRLRDARIREHGGNAGAVQGLGQLAGAAGAAQQENMGHD